MSVSSVDDDDDDNNEGGGGERDDFLNEAVDPSLRSRSYSPSGIGVV